MDVNLGIVPVKSRTALASMILCLKKEIKPWMVGWESAKER